MTENVNPMMGNQPVFPMGGVKAGATGNGEERITSLEIAEITGKPHNDVMKAIRKMEGSWFKVCQGKFSQASYEVQQPNGGTALYPCYSLTKRESLYIATKFNDEARARLVLRWEELEKKEHAQGSFAIPQSYSEALLLAANQAKQIEMQQKALEQKQVENDKLVADGKCKDATIVRMKPKEVFTDAVAGSKGNCLIGECAKLIAQNGYKIGEKQFFAWLRENGYLGKKGERYNIPNQQYVGKNALFYIKKGVRQGNSGVLHTTSTTMLTPKGQIYFVNKFLGKGGLQGDLFADGETHK